MDQAYNHFNSGKYKDAYKCSLLAATNLNNDSYEPNLAICEYLSNRCLQTSINCHKKLNQWLLKKLKRENYKLDCFTQSIVKFNIAILLILLGKRENALLVMTDIYKNRACFIEFMQDRIMLLLMETNINLRNSANVLTLYKKYPLKPGDSRNQSTQWISLAMHEHNKSSSVCKQQFYFLAKIFLNQALMQLSIPQQFLTSRDLDKDLKQQLIERVKRRKTGINKYYEINIRMISHFHEAQKELYVNNSVKCLQYMNLVNIQSQIEQMPSTKIITNILNALTTSNVGIVHFTQLKYNISLQYFLKAKALLSKGVTGGVQDKDLQLFSLNYQSHNDSISYNIALCLLAENSNEALQAFESIRKNNPNVQNFKWWYRMGQSILQNYHQLDRRRTDSCRLEQILEDAESCFACALSLVDKNKFPGEYLLKTIAPEITEQEIQLAHMKFKAQKRDFRKSIVSILCYIYNCLGKYSKTLKLGGSMLTQDLKKTDQLNILHYMMEAYIILNRQQETQQTFRFLKKQTESIKEIKTMTIYSKQPFSQHNMSYEDLFLYESAICYLKSQNPLQAASLIQSLRIKENLNPSPVLRLLLQQLHVKIALDKKFIDPYLK